MERNFSPLDLASGYWQIELDGPYETAFIVENNLYEFIRTFLGYVMPNASASFQRVMNYILRDVSGIKSIVYVADVIIFSETF